VLFCVTRVLSHPLNVTCVLKSPTENLRTCTIENISENDEDLRLDQIRNGKRFKTINSTTTKLPQSLPNQTVLLTAIDCGLQELFTGDKQFPELQELNVSQNKIQKLDNATFRNTPSLVVLNLSANKISEIVDAAFRALVYLQELDLSHNLLNVINFAEAFSSTTNKMIHSIDLNHNQLERVIGLHTLISLKKMDLSFNVGCDLTGCWSESILELSINGIDLTDREQSLLSLEKFENLDTLNLEENSITQMTIPQLKNLTRLSLAGNKMRTLNYAEIEVKLPKLMELNVTNNPWDCYALERLVHAFKGKKLALKDGWVTGDTNIEKNHCIMYDKERARLLLFILLVVLTGILVVIFVMISKFMRKEPKPKAQQFYLRSDSTHSIFE
jgi:Leucine-rich repeat (LRR) protein